jgi:hypothetical protein
LNLKIPSPFEGLSTDFQDHLNLNGWNWINNIGIKEIVVFPLRGVNLFLLSNPR